MPNPVVHFEIGCINTDAQQKFYASLFDWEITPASEEWNYGLVQHSEGGIGGGISDSGDDPPKPMVTFYVMVDDLQAYRTRQPVLAAPRSCTPWTWKSTTASLP